MISNASHAEENGKTNEYLHQGAFVLRLTDSLTCPKHITFCSKLTYTEESDHAQPHQHPDVSKCEQFWKMPNRVGEINEKVTVHTQSRRNSFQERTFLLMFSNSVRARRLFSAVISLFGLEHPEKTLTTVKGDFYTWEI